MSNVTGTAGGDNFVSGEHFEEMVLRSDTSPDSTQFSPLMTGSMLLPSISASGPGGSQHHYLLDQSVMDHQQILLSLPTSESLDSALKDGNDPSLANIDQIDLPEEFREASLFHNCRPIDVGDNSQQNDQNLLSSFEDSSILYPNLDNSHSLLNFYHDRDVLPQDISEAKFAVPVTPNKTVSRSQSSTQSFNMSQYFQTPTVTTVQATQSPRKVQTVIASCSKGSRDSVAVKPCTYEIVQDGQRTNSPIVRPQIVMPNSSTKYPIQKTSNVNQTTIVKNRNIESRYTSEQQGSSKSNSKVNEKVISSRGVIVPSNTNFNQNSVKCYSSPKKSAKNPSTSKLSVDSPSQIIEASYENPIYEKITYEGVTYEKSGSDEHNHPYFGDYNHQNEELNILNDIYLSTLDSNNPMHYSSVLPGSSEQKSTKHGVQDVYIKKSPAFSNVSVITSGQMDCNKLKNNNCPDSRVSLQDFEMPLAEDLQGVQYGIPSEMNSGQSSSQQQSPLHDISIEPSTQDLFAANGIRYTFTNSHASYPTDMALSFTNHFDNSNLSMNDIASSMEDVMSVSSSTSFNDLSKPSGNSVSRKSSSSSSSISDLTFTHALKANQSRRADEDLSKPSNFSFTYKGFSEVDNTVSKSKTREPVIKREKLVQEVSCLKCRVCSFLTLEKPIMDDHMKEKHPQYLEEDEMPILPPPNTKKMKVFLPKTSVEQDNQQQMMNRACSQLATIKTERKKDFKKELETVKPILNKLSSSPVKAYEDFFPDSSNLLSVNPKSEPDVKIQITDEPSRCEESNTILPENIKHDVEVKKSDEEKAEIKKKFLVYDEFDDKESYSGTRKRYTNKPGRPLSAQTKGISKIKKNQFITPEEEDKLFGLRCDVSGCGLRLHSVVQMKYHRKCHPDREDTPDVASASDDTPTFKCPECGLCAVMWRVLAGHLWKDHKIDIGLHKCELCDFKCYSMSRLMTTHFPSHSDVRPYLCEACGKVFKTTKHLRSHKVSMHTENKELQMDLVCVHCNKQFAEKRILASHVDIMHKKIKKFMCCYCGKAFGSKTTLNLHLRTHTGEKPFSCDHCDYKTSDHNSLRRHKMQHSSDRRYKCQYCDYSAIQSVSYKSHLATNHFEQAVADSLLFACSECEFKSVKLGTFRSHLSTKHNITLPSNFVRTSPEDADAHRSKDPTDSSNKTRRKKQKETTVNKEVTSSVEAIQPVQQETLQQASVLTNESEHLPTIQTQDILFNTMPNDFANSYFVDSNGMPVFISGLAIENGVSPAAGTIINAVSGSTNGTPIIITDLNIEDTNNFTLINSGGGGSTFTFNNANNDAHFITDGTNILLASSVQTAPSVMDNPTADIINEESPQSKVNEENKESENKVKRRKIDTDQKVNRRKPKTGLKFPESTPPKEAPKTSVSRKSKTTSQQNRISSKIIYAVNGAPTTDDMGPTNNSSSSFIPGTIFYSNIQE